MSHTILRIAGWEMYSPLGDKAALASAIENGQTVHDIYPDANGCCLNVPDFDSRTQLGKKGTRNFDRHTGLVVSTMNRLIVESGLSAESLLDMGIINGTATGSLSSILDFLLDTFRHEKPYFINPAHMPNTVMNCAAGQAAIWHRIKGPNATLAAGSQSFYAGLRKAQRWLDKGYVTAAIVGAVEDITDDTRRLYQAWYDTQSQPVVLAEGCGAFIVEPHDDQITGNDNDAYDLILSIESGTCFGDTRDKIGILSRLVEHALAQANISSNQIVIACTKAAPYSSSAQVEAQVAGSLHVNIRQFSCYTLMGHGYSAAGVFQFATLLNLLKPGEYGLALSASQNGSMACSVIRRGMH